ncbi:MAG: hypothetical protein GKR94_31420 [Gammaproteobacteria bacterium]|nr:hypothetical protein [Gammaproteobacteria bacterium]
MVNQRLIEIVGGIGSGKTTLANRLSVPRVSVVFEDHKLNPFWRAFYETPEAHAFETELTFLLQHYHFAKRSLESDALVVLDHSLELDLAYALVGLPEKRREIFRLVYQEVRAELGYPCWLIWLRCSPGEQMRRIRFRGRPEEESLSIKFLASLNRSLEHSLASGSRASELVVIDSEMTDLRRDGDWLLQLRKRIGA